jgi:TRAP-type C4-dicarboxylate transport system permease small subunit
MIKVLKPPLASTSIRLKQILRESTMIRIRLFFEFVGKLMSVMGTLCLIFVMMYIVGSVFSRAIIGKPFLGTFELGAIFLPVLAAFFYMNTDLHDRHIRATIIFDMFSPRIKTVLNAFYSLIGALIFFMVSWRVSIYGVRMHTNMCETSVLEMPVAPFIFVYAFLLFFYALYLIFKGIDYIGRSASMAADEDHQNQLTESA